MSFSAHQRYTGQDLNVMASSATVRGVRQEYEWVSRPSVVIAIPKTTDGMLVFVEQYRAAVGRFTIELPAGKVGTQNSSESMEDAVERELMEGAGYASRDLRYVGWFWTAPHFSNELCHVFTALGTVIAEVSPTPKELIGRRLVDPATVPGLISRGELHDAKSLAALWMLPSLRAE